MIVVSEGELPKPPGEPELVFDFSDGQSWWIGHSVSCPVCHWKDVLNAGNTLSSCGLWVYSFRYRNGEAAGRGRGVLDCPACRMPLYFDKELPAEAD